jgi:hypothetical protein
MNFLPIVDRELRMAARRTSTYRRRFYTALTAAALGAYFLWIFAVIRGGGVAIFAIVTECVSVFAVVSGSASYDSISKEKRDGTIGFLFLTDLKGYDIILGKLAASALPSIYAAMGVLPVLAIAMVMGGVNAHQFWETSFAVLNLFFLSHAVAMLGSALFRDQKNAMGFPALVAVGYLLELAFSAIAKDFHRYTASMVLEAFNPAHTLIVALAPVAPRGDASFGISLAAVHFTGWMFVALASWVLPHRWQEKPKKPNPLRAWWDQWRFGTVAKQAVLRRRLIGINPFSWLVSRRQFAPASVWIAFGAFGMCLVFLVTWAMKRQHAPWKDLYPPLFVLATVVLHSALKILVAGAAGGSLQTQRNNGGLEIVLCCTPLSATDMISGQWLALRRLFIGPALAVVVLGFGMIGAEWYWRAQRPEDAAGAMWFFFSATLLLMPDMVALGWTAMLMAMSEPKSRSIAGRAICSVCGAPWIIIGLMYTPWGAVRVIRDHTPPWIPWISVALIIDLGVCGIARRQLHRNFHKWAVPSYDPPLTFLGRLGRFLGRIFRKLKSNKLVN